MEQYLSDIPESLARSAHAGTSFTPEKRGEQTRLEYAATMAKDYADLRELAEKNGTLALVDAEFARYREGYAKRYRAYLSSSSRCVSTMIAGPSNFPAARMNKRAEVAHKRLEEFLDFRERALKAIRRTLCPTAGPIMAGDSDAVERLQAKILEAEAFHAQMKAVNNAHKAFLKNPASLETAPFSDETKNTIRNYKPSYSWEPHPFAPFEFTNSSANIRRMKERLAHLVKSKAATGFSAQGEKARLEDCPSENRVRLFYSGKPDEETRARLKSCGFRWTPTLGCWQAYRHQHTYDLAKKEAGCTEETIKAALTETKLQEAA